MSYRGRNYRTRNQGAERAAQHIQEAREFSEEVGGTDKDVKAYFFSIEGAKREEILCLYGRQYGAVKEAYAREAWSSWATGRKKMSGMVAKRLFALLPNHMPIAAKLQMVENLWRHSSPSSRTSIRIDSRSEHGAVILKVKEYFQDKLSHQIPDNFTRRFNWLSGADSQVKQQLLNHFRKLELGVVGGSLEPKLAVLRSHLQNNGSVFITGTHTVTIGNHALVLEFDNSEAVAAHNRAEEARRKVEEARRKAERAVKMAEFSRVFQQVVLVVVIIIVALLLMSAFL